MGDNYKWEMKYQADEVYEWYEREFPLQDYRKIADMMAKAYITSKMIGNRLCDAYQDWHFADCYAFAVLDMEEEFFQYQREMARADRYEEDKWDRENEPITDDCYSAIGW